MRKKNGPPTPQLHKAVAAGSLHAVRDLLGKGTDVDEEHGGKHAIHRAIEAGEVAITQHLMTAKADLELAGTEHSECHH